MKGKDRQSRVRWITCLSFLLHDFLSAELTLGLSSSALILHLTPALAIIVRATAHLLILFSLIVVALQAICVLEVDELLDLRLEACFFKVLLEILV